MQLYEIKKRDQHCAFGCGSNDLKIKRIDQHVEVFGNELSIVDFQCENCGGIDTLMVNPTTLKNILYYMNQFEVS